MKDERDQIREQFFIAWQRFNNDETLDQLQRQLTMIIKQHPEYHTLLENMDHLDQDYTDNSNPFLHMGLHLSIHEQLQLNRPAGIGDIYQTLCVKFGDAHTAEHRMMEILAQTLWEAQRNGQLPDEADYLAKLQGAHTH